MSDTLYFRQLLAGLDFAESDPIAQQMVNFSYLIGDRETGEALIVDPAYDAAGLVALAEADGMKLTGALVTHYHADHCGGDLMGHQIQGAVELLEITSIPVHIQAAESEWIHKTTSLRDADLVTHESGDTVKVGNQSVQLIHTPGHTPGSQCFFVDNRLVAGDTLFLNGCGRTDLPGGNPTDLYYSLTQRLSQVPDDAVLYPGHLYSPMPSASMGDTRRDNFVFRPKDAQQWLAMFG